MSRFIASADNIYKSLQTKDEHKIFNRLVRLRLTNEAFNRINNKNSETYLQTKQMIEDMNTETYSLEQLENKYLTTQQTYGESIRNYGFRLQDALEKYKQGYRIKYDIPRTDESYNKHLQINAVKTFKRGLNNTILKDKISLSTAHSIDEIVRQTEKIESMLLDTNVQSFSNHIEPIQAPSTTQITHYQQQSPIIICNYCNKPNHKYDQCRTRTTTRQMNQEDSTKTQHHNQETGIINHQCSTNQPNTAHTAKRPEDTHLKNVETNSNKTHQKQTSTTNHHRTTITATISTKTNKQETIITKNHGTTHNTNYRIMITKTSKIIHGTNHRITQTINPTTHQTEIITNHYQLKTSEHRTENQRMNQIHKTRMTT